MTNPPIDRTKSSKHGSEGPDRVDDGHPRLLSLVVGPLDEPKCTIYPPNVAVPHRSTLWISATGDGFVNLDRCQ